MRWDNRHTDSHSHSHTCNETRSGRQAVWKRETKRGSDISTAQMCRGLGWGCNLQLSLRPKCTSKRLQMRTDPCPRTTQSHQSILHFDVCLFTTLGSQIQSMRTGLIARCAQTLTNVTKLQNLRQTDPSGPLRSSRCGKYRLPFSHKCVGKKSLYARLRWILWWVDKEVRNRLWELVDA